MKNLTRDSIDSMKVGPELDALVAEILGYDILGITPCLLDPECGGYYLSYDKLADWETLMAESRPVFLYRCVCELGRPEDKNYFGHNAGCLGVVKEYSLEDTFAFEVVDWLVEQGYSITVITSANKSFCRIFEPDDSWEPNESVPQTFKWINEGRGETRALAICRASLKAFEQGSSVFKKI